jgi:HEPN domain-containing protein
MAHDVRSGSPALPDEWREVIVEQLAPLRPAQIYVFGSRARGDAGPHSDVDVLVVLDAPDGDGGHARPTFLRGLPVDVQVWTATRDDVARTGDSVGSFLYPVLREGMVIYGVDERDHNTWLRYAEEDVATAERMLQQEGFALRWACFLAQQAAEKALKAVLVREGTRFPYTHRLQDLRDLVPPSRRVAEVDADLATLTGWSEAARYPPAVEIGLKQAGRAVSDARAVVDAAREDVRR